MTGARCRCVWLPAQRFAVGQAVAVDPAAEAWGEADPLTDRERQVLRLAGEGRGGPDIAAELGLSGGTVRNLLSEAIKKVGGQTA